MSQMRCVNEGRPVVKMRYLGVGNYLTGVLLAESTFNEERKIPT